MKTLMIKFWKKGIAPSGDFRPTLVELESLLAEGYIQPYSKGKWIMTEQGKEYIRSLTVQDFKEVL